MVSCSTEPGLSGVHEMETAPGPADEMLSTGASADVEAAASAENEFTRKPGYFRVPLFVRTVADIQNPSASTSWNVGDAAPPTVFTELAGS